MNILFCLIEMKIEEQEASFLINFSIKMLKPAYFCQKKSLNLILILMKKLFCVTEIQNFLKMTKIFNYIEGVDMLNSIFYLIGVLSLGLSLTEGQNLFQLLFHPQLAGLALIAKSHKRKTNHWFHSLIRNGKRGYKWTMR